MTLKLETEKFMQLAEVLKTIAHPAKLSILELLDQHGSLSVGELQDFLSIEQSLLSHHLIKMKDRGILKSTKRGKFIFYELANAEIVKILGFAQ